MFKMKFIIVSSIFFSMIRVLFLIVEVTIKKEINIDIEIIYFILNIDWLQI